MAVRKDVCLATCHHELIDDGIKVGASSLAHVNESQIHYGPKFIQVYLIRCSAITSYHSVLQFTSCLIRFLINHHKDDQHAQRGQHVEL